MCHLPANFIKEFNKKYEYRRGTKFRKENLPSRKIENSKSALFSLEYCRQIIIVVRIIRMIKITFVTLRKNSGFKICNY